MNVYVTIGWRKFFLIITPNAEAIKEKTERAFQSLRSVGKDGVLCNFFSSNKIEIFYR